MRCQTNARPISYRLHKARQMHTFTKRCGATKRCFAEQCSWFFRTTRMARRGVWLVSGLDTSDTRHTALWTAQTMARLGLSTQHSNLSDRWQRVPDDSIRLTDNRFLNAAADTLLHCTSSTHVLFTNDQLHVMTSSSSRDWRDTPFRQVSVSDGCDGGPAARVPAAQPLRTHMKPRTRHWTMSRTMRYLFCFFLIKL